MIEMTNFVVVREAALAVFRLTVRSLIFFAPPLVLLVVWWMFS